MGRIRNGLTTLLLTGALLIPGCENTTTTQQKNVVCQEVESGKDLRVISIVSNQHYWNEKQPEVRAKVEEIVNGGEYNVVSVKTFYSDAYLTSAEVKYSVGEDCDDRDLRVIFVHSDKYYWNERQEGVKPRLDELVNSGTLDIQDVNSIMLKGYLVAAEVYHWEDSEESTE